MLRMILLGVGTAVPDQDRENTHMVWEAPDGLLLVDAGGSTFQRLLRAGLDPLALRGVFLTHSHADHINGLPVLLFQLALAGYQGTLPIYGNAPTLELTRQVVTAFDLGHYQVPVDWITVAGGQAAPIGAASYQLRLADTVHPRPCLALRFRGGVRPAGLVVSDQRLVRAFQAGLRQLALVHVGLEAAATRRVVLGGLEPVSASDRPHGGAVPAAGSRLAAAHEGDEDAGAGAPAHRGRSAGHHLRQAGRGRSHGQWRSG